VVLPQITVSIVVKEISTAPRTQMSMVLDTHWGVFADSLTVKLEPQRTIRSGSL